MDSRARLAWFELSIPYLFELVWITELMWTAISLSVRWSWWCFAVLMWIFIEIMIIKCLVHSLCSVNISSLYFCDKIDFLLYQFKNTLNIIKYMYLLWYLIIVFDEIIYFLEASHTLTWVNLLSRVQLTDLHEVTTSVTQNSCLLTMRWALCGDR